MSNNLFNKDALITISVDRCNKLSLLKFKLVCKGIFEKSSIKEVQNKNYIRQLFSLNSNILIKYGTDFLWSTTHRLNENLNSENLINDFLLLSFDAYYNYLIKNTTYHFVLKNDTEFILPSLQKNIPLAKNISYTFLKNKEGDFEIYANKIKLEIKTFKIILLENKIKFPFQKSLSIYEKSYIQDICTNTNLCNKLFTKVKEAILIIKKYDFELYQKLTQNLEFIVPNGNNKNLKYPNFSIASLKKVIFISIEALEQELLLVTESIIHEFSHCELHIIQDTILLCRNKSLEYIYYSPWRKDPRPLIGLIHAIYVSINIIKFYSTFFANKLATKQELEFVMDRVSIISHQILIAIRQINKVELNDVFFAMFEQFNLDTIQIMKEFNLTQTEIPSSVIGHIIEWKLKNKNLKIND
jgi:hypothetical protein